MAALCVSTMAAETTTITAPTNDDHVYEVYQIFTGKLESGVLSDVKWGENGTGETGKAVDSSILETLSGLANSSDADKLAKIKTYVNLDGDGIGTVTNGSSITVPTGYYLIKDNGPVTEGDAYSLYVVEVVGPTTITPKKGTTTSEKKVDDKNDSTTDEDETNWSDSADYDIGDEVPFLLKATIAEDYGNYEKYKLIFHDVESTGLTFKSDSVVVKVDGRVITSGYEVKTAGLEDTDCTFEVQFADLKQISSVEAGSVITVEYKSELNTSANIGSTGNPNTMYVEYSNNPNDEQGGETGETPEDKVIVFTYTLEVDKVDEDGNALTGAGFTLYKKNSSGKYEAVGEELTGDEMTTFTWNGVDDGDYKLVETTTPGGYNTMADLEFTISATHETTSDNPQLLTLTANKTFVGDKSTGKLSADIENTAGTTLPSTGGIGTTVFYVVGGIMVFGAAILLITKKRMSKDA